MKKIFSLLFSFILVFTLSSCGESTDTTNNSIINSKTYVVNEGNYNRSITFEYTDDKVSALTIKSTLNYKKEGLSKSQTRSFFDDIASGTYIVFGPGKRNVTFNDGLAIEELSIDYREMPRSEIPRQLSSLLNDRKSFEKLLKKSGLRLKK